MMSQMDVPSGSVNEKVSARIGRTNMGMLSICGSCEWVDEDEDDGVTPPICAHFTQLAIQSHIHRTVPSSRLSLSKCDDSIPF